MKTTIITDNGGGVGITIILVVVAFILIGAVAASVVLGEIDGTSSEDDLAEYAEQILDEAVLNIINKNEKRFVSFFNKAQPITNRIHSLQLIPGIGKKLMWEIIDDRKRLPYLSFSDIEERVKISDIRKMITNRIMQELEEEQKHRLFTASSEPNPRR